jgi:hypothetical protein
MTWERRWGALIRWSNNKKEYYKKGTCFKCKKIFSFKEEDVQHTVSKPKIEHKTITERKEVGSIKTDGNEVGKVYNDISHGYIREVRRHTYHITLRCNCCGKVKYVCTSSNEYGSWE